ncbi:histidine kinase [Aquimarina gracilis]|uniref:Histidine kinase n=1 Tax=Aquimarina gracilis TaxID=874422 RepID=A0ABU5ZP37_9FLAO|nr:histidine kinase [Aquimarina gracilis]MEB3343905.1 histidine kinase [Aquimarina gracilis]
MSSQKQTTINKIVASFIWVVAALFTSTFLYLKTREAGDSESWLKLFLVQLAVWSVWGLLSPIIFRLGKRFRIDKQTYYAGILIHLLFATIIVLLYLSVYSGIWNLVDDEPFYWKNFLIYFKIFFLNLFHWHFFIYMAIIGIAHAQQYYQELEHKRQESLALEKQLLLSELNTLKAQLSPHFLFNTINNVIGTIEQKKHQEAIGMLIKLGEFLRSILEDTKHKLIPLEKELFYINQYLEIEKFRNQELQIEIHKNEGCLQFLVPSFLLQPIVENAIKHGISKKKTANLIEIGMECETNSLKLWVYNEGPNVLKTEQDSFGIGLTNTISRLKNTYDHQASFELLSVNDGVIAEVKLPMKH